MYFLSTLTTMLQGIPPIFLKFISIAVGMFAIGFIIAFHELGHFSFAKLFNIKTPSFSIGFGPQLFSKKIGDTTFSLSAIPAGGYVEIADQAEESTEEQSPLQETTTSHYFSSRPYWQKLLVMLGGIIFNLFLSYALFILLFAAGIPKSKYMCPLNNIPVIEEFSKGSAAEQAGFLKDDRIIAIQDVTINDDVALLLKELQSKPNKEITISIMRNNEKMDIPVTLKSHNDRGVLGVSFKSIELPPQKDFLMALKEGIAYTNALIKNVAIGYLGFFTKRDLSNTQGPLGIIAHTASESAQGFKNLLILIAIISANLAILNLIPLPILDGGQILFVTLEAILGRQIPLKIKEYIHIASWIFILGILLYASYNDILAIIRAYFA